MLGPVNRRLVCLVSRTYWWYQWKRRMMKMKQTLRRHEILRGKRKMTKQKKITTRERGPRLSTILCSTEGFSLPQNYYWFLACACVYRKLLWCFPLSSLCSDLEAAPLHLVKFRVLMNMLCNSWLDSVAQTIAPNCSFARISGTSCVSRTYSMWQVLHLTDSVRGRLVKQRIYCLVESCQFARHVESVSALTIS